jgi:hypothetical protein
MNERIRELVRQAGLDDADFPIENWDNVPLEKFAELIVQECIERGNVLVKHYIDNHSEQEQVFLLAAIADYSNEIEKHFGVEE